MDGKDRMMTAEFCPQCYHPFDVIDEAEDDGGRLCSVCRWFGDKTEICVIPPAPTTLELAFTQLLALYRDVCRMELLAEQLAGGQAKYNKSLNAVRARANHARHSIIHLFRMTKDRGTGLEDDNEDNETPA